MSYTWTLCEPWSLVRCVAPPADGIDRRYRRRPWDSPWRRWPVQRIVPARRFLAMRRAVSAASSRSHAPRGSAARPARAERLRQVRLELAQASGAELAARRRAGWRSEPDPDPLIRHPRAEQMARPAPHVLGVDACALRPGLSLCDAPRGPRTPAPGGDPGKADGRTVGAMAPGPCRRGPSWSATALRPMPWPAVRPPLSPSRWPIGVIWCATSVRPSKRAATRAGAAATQRDAA